jgi:hypothetical protein
MARLHVSPFGPLIHPWLTKADTKFNADGLFHTELHADGTDAESLKKRVTEAAQAAFDEETAKMKPGEAKKWSLYVPFEDLTDDETGEPNGTTKFDFKQNDSQDKPVTGVVIYSGSIGRIMFSMRKIVMTSSKQIGVRLDFSKVQIKELKTGGGGFGAIDDGYVGGGSQSNSEPEEDAGGEY